MTAQASHDDAPHCPCCGYNLFGIQSTNCPECGLAFDRTQFGISQIPWTHRKSIGFFAAFFRTVRFALLHPRRLAEEMNRPVSLAEAQKFRYICVAIGAGCFLGLAILLINELEPEVPFSMADRLVATLLAIVSGWLFWLAFTGLPSLLCRPGNLTFVRQNRAVAISYYSSSALIFLPVPLVLGIVFAWIQDSINVQFSYLLNLLSAILIFAACILSVAIIFESVYCASILVRRAAHRTTMQFWLAFFLLLGADAVLFIAIPLGIPLLAFYVSVITASLR